MKQLKACVALGQPTATALGRASDDLALRGGCSFRLATVLLLLVPAAVALAADKPLSLSAAIEEAKTNQPSLKAAKAEVDAARARSTMLEAPFKPMIGLNAFGSVGRGDMIFGSSTDPLSLESMGAAQQGTLDAAVMWRPYSFGRDRVSREVGSSEVRAAEQNLRIEEADVALRVRTAFSEAVLRHDELAAHQAALDSAEEVLKTTQTALDTGKVPEAFLLRAHADVAAMRRELALAQSEAEAALAALKEAVGESQDTAGVLGEWDSPLDAPGTLADAIREAKASRPELAGLAASQAEHSLRARLFSLSGLPDLSLTAMGDVMGMSDSVPGGSYRLGVVLSFPLADGGERRSGRAEENAMAAKASAELDAEVLKVESETAQAWARRQAAPKVREAAEEEEKASAEAYRVALFRYREGKAILAEVIDARAQLVAAQLAKAEADDYARRAWAALKRACGG
jgi:outer membrane protein TolC